MKVSRTNSSRYCSAVTVFIELAKILEKLIECFSRLLTSSWEEMAGKNQIKRFHKHIL